MTTDYSPADIAAMSNGGNNNGFGGDAGIWYLILFLFAFGGGNWGNWGNNGGGATTINVDSAMQRGFDQSAVMNALGNLSVGQTNGFADAAVARCNQTMNLMEALNNGNIAALQGFNNTQNAVNQGFNSTLNAMNQGFNATQMGLMNGTNTLQQTMMANEMARQQCCCDTKQAIADLKYTISTEACADRQAVTDALQAMTMTFNNGFQAIMNRFTQQDLDAKNDLIANLRTQINMQNLAASQTAQTAELISQLKTAA